LSCNGLNIYIISSKLNYPGERLKLRRIKRSQEGRRKDVPKEEVILWQAWEDEDRTKHTALKAERH
jgi:hypothetical protein